MPQARLLLFIVINLWNVHATKYCSYELNGDPKYFVCARNEYCCNLGCCVHLAFQFYQLWYYWLLLIFMFMICSGGSWWYKFCRQSDSASNYPSIPLAIERTSRHSASEVHGRRAAARALDRASANEPASYHFHRIWKANNLAASPNYYTGSTVRYHSSHAEVRRQHFECPYYQLYGPPPSYESVVRLSDSAPGGHTSCVLLPAADNSPAPLYAGAPLTSPLNPSASPKENESSSPKQMQGSMLELMASSQSSAASSPVEATQTDGPLSLAVPVRVAQRSGCGWPGAFSATATCIVAQDSVCCHQARRLRNHPVIHEGQGTDQAAVPGSSSYPHDRPMSHASDETLLPPSANPMQDQPPSLCCTAATAPAPQPISLLTFNRPNQKDGNEV